MNTELHIVRAKQLLESSIAFRTGILRVIHSEIEHLVFGEPSRIPMSHSRTAEYKHSASHKRHGIDVKS